MNKDLRKEAVNIAYKAVSLPSGCSNCWGDLGQGCTDECRASSNRHSEKIDEVVTAITALLKVEVAKAKIEGRRVMYNELWKLASENPPEEGTIKILKRLGDMHDEIMAEGKKALAEVESDGKK